MRNPIRSAHADKGAPRCLSIASEDKARQVGSRQAQAGRTNGVAEEMKRNRVSFVNHARWYSIGFRKWTTKFKHPASVILKEKIVGVAA